jgi:hypothetical protein
VQVHFLDVVYLGGLGGLVVMQLRNLFFVLIFSVTLTGCATPPEYTQTYDSDPFKTIDPKSKPRFATAKLCLFTTENANKALFHVSEIREMGANPMFGWDTAALDPNRIVSDITDSLNQRFRETVRVDKIEGASALGCNIVLALDLKIKIGHVAFTDSHMELGGTFFDLKGGKIDAFSSSNRDSMWSLTGPGAPFRKAWQSILAEFDNKLDKSVAVDNYIAGLPSYAAPSIATEPAASTTIDLAFWDSVKNSTNPADFQAYLQKFPNGSFESLARSRLVALSEPMPPHIKPIAQPTNGKFNFGNYYALVIGNNNYRSVTPLKTAAIDAKEVAEELKKDYGFKVTLLLDATRNQMLDSFDDLRRTLTENDNLLIYYAGHGYLDTDSDRGFWLPVDADANHRANWLSNSDLTDMVRATRAKHVLVVADSCYAGTLTRTLSVQMTGLDNFSRLAQKRARTALTSGGLEPVEDSGGGQHSIFAKAFLGALQSNTGVVDMSQIFSSMRREVILGSQQTPQYGDIRQTGHEGGDFIFVRKNITGN